MRANAVGLSLAFGAPLGLFLATMAPGLTWAHAGADGGDLITAAYTLGIPHPPGYPTYTLLAWLFTRLPVGSVAWRVHLLSAGATAGAAALLFETVQMWVGGRAWKRTVAGLGAAWSLAFAPLVWSQAIIAEVYGVALLWTGLVLLLASRLARAPVPGTARRWAFLLGLSWSLGLGVHLTLVFLIPLVIWAVHRSERVAWASLAGGVLLGLAVWLYLPLRAGRGSVTWGEPTDWAGFWWLASGALYRGYLFALPAQALPARLAFLLRRMSGDLGWLGVIWAGWGVGWLKSHRPGLLGATALSAGLFTVYAVGYNTADSYAYLLPVLAILALWAGIGLGEVVARAGRRWGPVLALGVPLVVLGLNYSALDLSREREARDFVAGVEAAAPPGAIVVTDADGQTFALWYARFVEGRRPDLIVVDRALWGYPWYRRWLARRWPDLAVPSGGGVEALLTANPERPFCEVPVVWEGALTCVTVHPPAG